MASTSIPPSWIGGPVSSFSGKITPEGPFKPEKGRYHLYVGLHCPFAHRVNILLHLKHLDEYAGIETSIVRPYPKGDENGWPGWQFNVKGEQHYEGATEDRLYGSKYLHELYFKANKDYKGRYTVPVLWDKELETIVNNESHELLRDLQTSLDVLLPKDLQEITLYPTSLRDQIDVLGAQLQRDLNTGVYKTGCAKTQEVYENNLPAVFAMLNKLERLASQNGGPYILGARMTEVDVRTYATLIRFDVAYAQHFKCNLGTIRYSYPFLSNWLKSLYWNNPAYQVTTDFRHIKESYTKGQLDINPSGITPMGPWPHIETSWEADWSKLTMGRITMPEVVEYEKSLG